MSVWDYKVQPFSVDFIEGENAKIDRSLQDWLNCEAEDGWELVTIQSAPEFTKKEMAIEWFLVFKRPAETTE